MVGMGRWGQGREAWSTRQDTSKKQPHVYGARPPRTLGMSRGPWWHWEQPGGTLGRELQTEERFKSRWETNVCFLSSPWRKMILGGRLAPIPPCRPFFLGCASFPGHCLSHSSSGPNPGITSSRKSSQMPSVWTKCRSSVFP